MYLATAAACSTFKHLLATYFCNFYSRGLLKINYEKFAENESVNIAIL